MYQPEKYKNNKPDFIFPFIKAHPFATIVMQGIDLLATHIPVLVEGNSQNYRLYAHIANHNAMRELLLDNKEVLIIFTGPNAYISSSWYNKPDIPTWDYTAVHVNAKIKIQTDSELQLSLENLIHRFENNQHNPLDIDKIPTEIWNENFKEITGFWIEPYKMLGIEKLHQGFKKEELLNIVNKLDTPTCPYPNVSDLLNKKHDLNK